MLIGQAVLSDVTEASQSGGCVYSWVGGAREEEAGGARVEAECALWCVTSSWLRFRQRMTFSGSDWEGPAVLLLW